jgi:hypothetical protein
MTCPFFVIARKLNKHRECDFLTNVDHPRGSWCLGAMHAMRFTTQAKAEITLARMQRANPNDELSLMTMTDTEARKPGFWVIADEWVELSQRRAAAPLMAKRPQELDTSALPLFGDSARQMDLLDMLKG